MLLSEGRYRFRGFHREFEGNNGNAASGEGLVKYHDVPQSTSYLKAYLRMTAM